MTSNLEWEPVDRKKKPLGALKFILRAEYSDPVDVVMSSDDTPFLRGVIAAAQEGNVGGNAVSKEALELIEAIEKHGEIHVKEYY